MTDWPDLIRRAMKRQRVTQRGLCIRSGVNRTTFRRFMAGAVPLRIDHMDALLRVLGTELDAIPVGPAKCQSAPHPYAPAAASSDPVNVAAINSTPIESAKPALTKSDHQPEIVGTTRSGAVSVRPTSQQIRDAAAAVRLRPSSITRSLTEAIEPCSGGEAIGNPCASPVTTALSKAPNVAAHNRAILARIASTFHEVAA